MQRAAQAARASSGVVRRLRGGGGESPLSRGRSVSPAPLRQRSSSEPPGERSRSLSNSSSEGSPHASPSHSPTISRRARETFPSSPLREEIHPDVCKMAAALLEEERSHAPPRRRPTPERTRVRSSSLALPLFDPLALQLAAVSFAGRLIGNATSAEVSAAESLSGRELDDFSSLLRTIGNLLKEESRPIKSPRSQTPPPSRRSAAHMASRDSEFRSSSRRGALASPRTRFFLKQLQRRSFSNMAEVAPDPVQELLNIPVEGPLNNVVVISFEQHLSGPTASEELAKSGALVIKVEPPNGDAARTYGKGPYFNTLNAGKASTQLDREAIKIIMEKAEHVIVIDNRRADSKTQLEEDMQEVAAKRKTPLVYVSITGYDPEGPHRNDPAFDTSVQSASGLVNRVGSEKDPPGRIGSSIIDIATGLTAATQASIALMGILLGQTNKDNTKGNIVRRDIPMIAVALATLQAPQLADAAEDRPEQRHGNRHPRVGPFSLYQVRQKEEKDGDEGHKEEKNEEKKYIAIAVADDTQFGRLWLDVFKQKAIPEKYATNELRMQNADELENDILRLLEKDTVDHWIEALQKHSIPGTKVETTNSALEKYWPDFITKARDGTLLLRSPVYSQQSSGTELAAAPELGAQTGAVKALAAELATGKSFDHIRNDCRSGVGRIL